MKRVLLVQAYLGRKEPKGAIFPLGLCYLATALAGKHETEVFDPNTCDGDPYAELLARAQEFRPDVVGISIRNIDTLDKRDIFYYFKAIPKTVRLLKDRLPHVKVVVGGAGFSIFAREIMAKVPGIDFGVYLEGEATLPELLDKLDTPQLVRGVFYRKAGVVEFAGERSLPDFRNLPVPRKDFVDMKRYGSPLFSVGIQTKRGCPSRCAYCSYPFLNGNMLRLRSPAGVVDEIEYHVREFGVRQFMFVDGIFNVPERHAEDICNEIIRRGLDVEWAAWCEIGHLTGDFLALAKKAGCRALPFSPDGASDAALYSLGKDISAADIDRAVRLVRKHREIKAGFGFFCTPPGQTFFGLCKTVYLYLKINALLLARGGASLSWIRIEPHTRMEQIALDEGFITRDTDLLPDREEDLEALFYTSRPGWKGDRPVEALLGAVKVAKLGLEPLKGLARLFKPARPGTRPDGGGAAAASERGRGHDGP